MRDKKYRPVFCTLSIFGLMIGFGSCGGQTEPATIRPTVVKVEDVVIPPKSPCVVAIEVGAKRGLVQNCKEATGTIGMASELQLLAKDSGSLLSLLASQRGNAPSFAPGAELNVGGVIASALNKIMKRLRNMEALAVQSRAAPWKDLEVQFDSLELALNVADLIADGASNGIPADLKINLAGQWNRVEVVFLGGLASTTLSLLDLLLAHNIKLDLATMDGLNVDNMTSSVLAGFVAANPDLFSLDSAATFKESGSELRTALDLLAGTAAAGAGNEGLLAALDEQLAKDDDQTDNLLQIIDRGTKGKFDLGDVLVVKTVENAVNELTLMNPPANPGRIENKYLSRGSLDDVTGLGRAIKDHLAGEGVAPINLKAYLGNLWTDLKAYTGNNRIAAPQAWLAIAPKKFFDTAKPLRSYLPGIYAVNVSAGATVTEYTRFDGTLIADAAGMTTDIVDNPRSIQWEFAFECELAYTAVQYSVVTNMGVEGELDGNSGWRTFCGAGSKTGTFASKAIAFGVNKAADDVGHFEYQVVAGPPATAPVVHDTFVWAKGFEAIAAFGADNQFPRGVSPVAADGLPVFGLQDASLGGLLLVDPTGKGNFVEADNLSFNATLAVMYNTYIDDIEQGIDKVRAKTGWMP